MEISPITMMTRFTKAMKARFFMLSLTSQSTVVLCAEMGPEFLFQPTLDRLGKFNRSATKAIYGRPNKTSATGQTRWHGRSEEHTHELQSRGHLVCRLPLRKKND